MSPASPISRLTAAHWPLWAVCALFLLAGALALDDYGISGDEQYQRLVGNAALDYLAGDGERAFDQLPDTLSQYYGAAFEAPLALLLERIIGLEDSRDISLGRHFLTHLFFLVGGVFCYLLVHRLFGSRPLALIATVLFLLHPRIYAHSFFNTKDIPFLAMSMIALWLTHRAFRRDTLAAFLLCGVGVGLLVNLRIMGVILFVAVLALRVLDMALAGSGEWRRALLSGGGFALAAVLAYYASLPALWTDPFGQFAELTRTLGGHPYESFHLFRGEWLYSRDGPPLDYVPVWVGITTPPATLLLALAGAVALAWRSLRRPRDILRDGPLRFGILLIALPVATTAAIVVLKSNVYHDWRQLYFLYAPLLLLAAFGLHGIMAVARGRWPRVGAYALAGGAIAVALVSMVRIHPYEDNHFTLLTDRTTPERPESRYEMDYWGQYVRPVLTGILRDHPSGAVFVSPSSAFARLQIRALPPRERERITVTKDFRSGERNFLELHRSQPCLAPRPATAYAARIYATTLHCVVEPVAWLGGLRRRALATEPLVRSVYDIHRDGRLLTYLRDGCPPGDVAGESDGPRLFLHVAPLDPGDLPSERGLDFDNLDAALRGGSARIDGNCVAVAVLPDYPIASIRTGQITDDGILWEVEFAPDGRGVVPPAAPDYAAARREALAGEPLARSFFDIYRDGRELTYVRDGCTEAEAEARFFLHAVPADAGDLPEHRREHGFDNLDFALAARGARIDGNCVAVVRLPDYPIATVRTGQYDGTGALWTAEFALPDGE